MQRRSILSGESLSTSVQAREITDPWTGEAIGEQLLVGPEQIDAAMAAAHGARAACAALPPWKRAQILEAMGEGVRRRREELVEAIVAEAGKPVRFARGEVDRCLHTLRFAAEEARRPQGETVAIDAVPAGDGRLGIVLPFPAGVVVGIAPFNFPLNLVAHKVAPAIAAGCPWIIKPGDPTPTPALILAELAVAAGWPADGAHVLLLSREHAPLLVADERPAVISFTGSDRVGWQIKANAGRKRVLLELGGAAPVLVHEDADLDRVAERVPYGAFAYAGQVCISVQRLLVHEAVIDEVRARLVAEVRDAAWGDPREEGTLSGPMIDARATDKVLSRISDALAGGARLLAGGQREGERLVRPTLLEGVPLASPLVQQELFGPGLVLESFSTLDHGIALANASPWGLQVGVFARDVGAVMRCHRELEYAGVMHDEVPTFRVDHMPYGGIKASGLGREGLRYSIAEYSEPRLLVLRR